MVEDLLNPVIPEAQNLSIGPEESTALMMLPMEDSDFLNQNTSMLESSPLKPIMSEYSNS